MNINPHKVYYCRKKIQNCIRTAHDFDSKADSSRVEAVVSDCSHLFNGIWFFNMHWHLNDFLDFIWNLNEENMS